MREFKTPTWDVILSGISRDIAAIQQQLYLLRHENKNVSYSYFLCGWLLGVIMVLVPLVMIVASTSK
jgi:hypothetical protein